MRVSQRVNERERSEEGKRKSAEKSNLPSSPRHTLTHTHTHTPLKNEISQHNRTYQSTPLFNDSDVSGYQEADRCDESEGGRGDERRCFVGEEIH